MTEIEINGEIFVPKNCKGGPRFVLVLDRGWIFAGDLNEDNGRITMRRAVMVRKWSGTGFDGMLSDPKSDGVTLELMPTDVDVPRESELFRLPVDDDWGL